MRPPARRSTTPPTAPRRRPPRHVLQLADHGFRDGDAGGHRRRLPAIRKSAVGSAAYTINLTAATPAFSPAGGSLYVSADCNHQRCDRRRDHLLHHQRNHAYDRIDGITSSPVTVAPRRSWKLSQQRAGMRTARWLRRLTPSGASGAIDTVQHNSGSTESGTTLAVSFASNVTSGNVILVAESTYDAETLGNADGHEWQQLHAAGDGRHFRRLSGRRLRSHHQPLPAPTP